MSNILSSFLIDPVLRQARRFSPTVIGGTDAEFPGNQLQANSRSSCETDACLSPLVSHDVSQHSFHIESEDIQSSRPLEVPTNRGNRFGSLEHSHTISDALVHQLSGIDQSGITHSQHAFTNASNASQSRFRRARSFTEAEVERMRVMERRSSSGYRNELRRRSLQGRNDSGLFDDGNRNFTKIALPEDDGMCLLRRRIQLIQQSALPLDLKARRLHELMTEGYHSLEKADNITLSYRSQMRQVSHQISPSKILSEPSRSTSSPNGGIELSGSYKVTEDDYKPSYRPLNQDNNKNPNDSFGELDTSLVYDDFNYGCVHYKRNVKIQCFECDRWYTCRHCHDENEGHSLNRRKTRNMLCMICKTPQPARQDCSQCDTCAASYFCDICKLWDDDTTKDIYHCDDCGICRRGKGLGKDFVHCKKCNVCLAISVADTHRCIERATECDCPICGDYLFTSSESVAALPCGHYMHRVCYDEYIIRAYKCPLCNKSAVNMELLWHELDQQSKSQLMPPKFARTSAVISCNDCSARSMVKYHWVGHKCAICGSYNTNDLQILENCSMEEEDKSSNRPAASPDSNAHSPRSFSRTFSRSDRRVGPYFTQEEYRQAALSPNDEQNRFSPYEMLQRMSLSLPPIRTYLARGLERAEEAGEAAEATEMTGATSCAHGEECIDFWGADGHFLLGEEEEGNEMDGGFSHDNYEDDDTDDEESSQENTESEDLRDENDDGEDDLDSLELPGHI